MTSIREPRELPEPRLFRFLFASATAAWLWLPIRLFVGWQWLASGLQKLGAGDWTGAKAGAALTGFATGALQKTTGAHPDVQGWYATFLHDVVIPNAVVFAWAVTLGETLVGVALILGAFSGVAAFFGIVMNTNYLFAGSFSVNPILIVFGALIALAWRNAGWIGFDRVLLAGMPRRRPARSVSAQPVAEVIT